MHPRLAAMPPRFRQIVLEELAAARFWVGEDVSLDQLFLTSVSGNVPGNRRCVSKVRDAIWWRLRDEISAGNGRAVSVLKIGGWFGRDHTSVSDGAKRHPKRLVEWAAGKQKLYQQQRAAQNEVAAHQFDNVTVVRAA